MNALIQSHFYIKRDTNTRVFRAGRYSGTKFVSETETVFSCILFTELNDIYRIRSLYVRITLDKARLIDFPMNM